MADKGTADKGQAANRIFGLPFEVKVPSATTVATFEATDRGEDIVRCKDAADMFDKLGL